MSFLASILRYILVDLIKEYVPVLIEYAQGIFKKKKDEKDAKSEAKEYNEVVNKPGVSRQERKDAEENLSNK